MAQQTGTYTKPKNLGLILVLEKDNRGVPQSHKKTKGKCLSKAISFAQGAHRNPNRAMRTQQGVYSVFVDSRW